MTRPRIDPSHHGLFAALGAYVLWGFMPLLFHALATVPPIELVAWRVMFSLPLCFAYTALASTWDDLTAALRQPGVVLKLLLSALLVASNWGIYVTAVVRGHVLATSLGYYINPLLNVLIGTVVLREKLGWRQWAAVAIAGGGIALLAAGALTMLSTAISLAATFAFYGLVRKLTPVSALAGLTIETMVLYPVAVGWLLLASRAPGGLYITHGGLTAVLLAGTGLATTVPLILFAIAARRLPLSTLGFLQFAAPTIVFMIGVALGEVLRPVELVCFVLIWISAALFLWDVWRRSRLVSPAAAS